MRKQIIVPEARETLLNGKEHIYPQGFHPDALQPISWQGYHLASKGVFIIETHSPEECFDPVIQTDRVALEEVKPTNILLDGSAKSKKGIEDILGRKLKVGEDGFQALKELAK